MHKSRAVNRILAGGNRGGKSFGAQGEILPYLFWPNTTGWLVSADYSMAYEIMRKILNTLDNKGYIKGTRPDRLNINQYFYSTKEHILTMWNGSTLQLKSAENPDSMNAVPVDYIVLDEGALFPFQYYDSRLIPRLIDSGGWILSVGTFENLRGEWFEEYYEIGKNKNDWDIESFSMPTTENFFVYPALGGETPEKIGAVYGRRPKAIVKMNPDLEWPLKPGEKVFIYNIDLEWLAKQKRRIDPQVFSARYLAEPSPNSLRVFPSYTVSTYVDDEKAKFDKELPVYLAIDPGGTYAVAVVQFKELPILPGFPRNELSRGYSVCIIDELYFQTTITVDEIWSVMQHREWFANLGRKDYQEQLSAVIDVMTPEQKRAWQLRARKEDAIGNKMTIRARKVGIQDGNMTLQHYLDSHTIWVNSKCKFFNLEMQRYQYPEIPIARAETADPRRSTNPKDAWNHEVKAVIYLLVVKFGLYHITASKAVMTLEDIWEERRKTGYLQL